MTDMGWFIKQKQVTVTTWKLRALVAFLVIAILYGAYPSWLEAVSNQLVHETSLEPAEALLLENFDPYYEVFITAKWLLKTGYSSRVFIPLLEDEDDPVIERGFVEVMSRAAGIEEYELIPVRTTEPISLNVARQIADRFEAAGVRSVIVVSPRYRSARSYLVYETVLAPRGIRVQCLPGRAERRDQRWWETLHGIQNVFLEFSKLLYYRLWVL